MRAFGPFCILLLFALPCFAAPETHHLSKFHSDPDDQGQNFEASQRIAERPRSIECQPETETRHCGIHIVAVLNQSLEFATIQTTGNLLMDKWVRRSTFRRHFFRNYFESVEHFRFNRWSDDDSFLADYIGHPMMGSVTNYIWIQNDPKYAALEFQNTRRYWWSRTRAFAFSAVYAAQWKVGPISEASFGNTGQVYYHDLNCKCITNGTGLVDWVVTPIGGLTWTLYEDWFDRKVTRRVDQNHHDPWKLAAIAVLTPTRSFANLLRFRAPWYRDSRRVSADW